MLVSVITATFNSERTVKNTIKSINEQTYKNIQHIFIDGLSTDNTVATIRQLSKRDNLIISESDSGIYDALNKGLSHCDGDIICFVHSDDQLANDHVIEDVVSTFESNDFDAVYGDLRYQDSNGNICRNWIAGEFNQKKLQFGWMAPHPALFLRRHVFKHIGNFNNDFKISADYDFELRFFKNSNHKVQYLHKVLVHMTLGGASNKNLKNIIKKLREDINVLKNNGFNCYVGVFFKNFRKLSQLYTLLFGKVDGQK